MKKPIFSIIIPIHIGVKKYLDECLESVYSQTCQEYEIIVQNDTPDWNPKLKTNPKLKIINNNKNYGLSTNRNLALARSTGEWIVTLDGDDKLPKTILTDYMKVINKHNSIDWLIGVGENFGSNKWKSDFSDIGYGVKEPKMLVEILEKYGNFTFHTMQGCFRKTTVDIFSGWPALPRDEDTAFMAKITTSRNGYILEKPSYFYRRHENQMSQSEWFNDAQNKILARRIIAANLIERKLTTKDKMNKFIYE